MASAALSKNELIDAVEQSNKFALSEFVRGRSEAETTEPFAELFLRALSTRISNLADISLTQIRTICVPGIVKTTSDLHSPWEVLFGAWVKEVANTITPRQMNSLLNTLTARDADPHQLAVIAQDYLNLRLQSPTTTMLWKLTDGDPRILIPYLKQRYRHYTYAALVNFKKQMAESDRRLTDEKEVTLFGVWLSTHAKPQNIPAIAHVDLFVDDYLTWRLRHLNDSLEEPGRMLTFLTERKTLPSFTEYAIAVERLDGDYNITLPLDLFSQDIYEEAFHDKITTNCSEASRIITSD